MIAKALMQGFNADVTEALWLQCVYIHGKSGIGLMRWNPYQLRL